MKFLYVYTTAIISLLASGAHAFDNKFTHPALTQMLLDASSLKTKTYMKIQLGYRDGWNKTLPGLDGTTKTIAKLFGDGATAEDSPVCRASNHFHNPLAPSWQEGRLTDTFILTDLYCAGAGQVPDQDFSTKYSNLIWATGQEEDGPMPQPPNNSLANNNGRNWDVARQFFYDGLVAPTPWYRDTSLAVTFETLGYVLHLLEDMAVPAHTRNDLDGHLFPPLGNRWFHNPFEDYVVNNWRDGVRPAVEALPVVHYTGPRKLTAFWDRDVYLPNSVPTAGRDIGLAEYTNGNFVSDYTIFKDASDAEHYFPFPAMTSTDIDQSPGYVGTLLEVPAADGQVDQGLFIAKRTDGEAIDHFLALRYLADEVRERSGEDVVRGYRLATYLNGPCHLDYATKLIPRAIGYGADLVDYFFRGSLEISPPTAYVYAIIDGGGSPQRFTHLKAKVRNTSVNTAEDGTTTPEPIGEAVGEEGHLVAVARYREVPNYLEDLSNLPQDATSLQAMMAEVPYSYAVSAPVLAIGLNADPEAAREFVFDFSATPIPVGITDLTLQVVFRGTLGAEKDVAVAVGTKELNEPQHLVFWNNTDWFVLNGEAVRPDDIRNDPYVMLLGLDVEPVSCREEVGFSASNPTAGVAPAFILEDLPPGRYSKVICLTDNPSGYVVTNHYTAAGAPGEEQATFPGMVNREDPESGWQSTPLHTIRGIALHYWMQFMKSYPEGGYVTLLAPEENTLGPYPATILFP